MALAVLRHHPKRIIPVVCADRKCLPSERKFRTDILSRPKGPPTRGKDEPGQVLDGTTESSKSHDRHSKADPFVVFLRFHHQDAKHVFEHQPVARFSCIVANLNMPKSFVKRLEELTANSHHELEEATVCRRRREEADKVTPRSIRLLTSAATFIGLRESSRSRWLRSTAPRRAQKMERN